MRPVYRYFRPWKIVGRPLTHIGACLTELHEFLQKCSLNSHDCWRSTEEREEEEGGGGRMGEGRGRGGVTFYPCLTSF